MLKSAIMKRYSLTTMAWWLYMAITILLTGCETTLTDPCEELTKQRILQFREYCYDANGNVRLTHQEGDDETEWVIPVNTSEEVQQVFHRLTGLAIVLTAHLEYAYHSEDYRYACRLVGGRTPVNQRYASLYLWIEGCPEIEIIHFVVY